MLFLLELQPSSGIRSHVVFLACVLFRHTIHLEQWYTYGLALSRRRGSFRLLLWHRWVLAIHRLDVHVCYSALDWLKLRAKPSSGLLLRFLTTYRLNSILVLMLVLLWLWLALLFNLF